MPTPPPSLLRAAFSQGTQWIWLTGAALSVCLLMIAGLLLVVMFNGLGAFWPHQLIEADLTDGSKILGVVTQVEQRPSTVEQTATPTAEMERWQFKVGNRDLYGVDFRWVNRDQLRNIVNPPEAFILERSEYGDFYGYLVSIKDEARVVAEGQNARSELRARWPAARQGAEQAHQMQKHQIGEINYKIQKVTLALKRLELRASSGADQDAAIAQQRQALSELNAQFDLLRQRAAEIEARSRNVSALFRSVDGRETEIPLMELVRAYQPNQLSWPAQLTHYASKVWEFISGEPRESNTEGGILPAIFGTVFMTLIMSVAVVPFGVLAAFYLREYAKQGPIVRVVRIAVNNLAGVPSIVFGVFGLGFFVYFVGGSIDRLFYPELLPQPTYGTGGILWASLTLALLTVPVVIVATEESIAAVPRGAKEGSLALGATKFQTICRVVLPASLPGILTGLILAVARGAGEVAPLMITGVVKLAPSLPLDGQFPYLHLERKFMHLGFHIFDVGFQSPNVEAAKPMVFSTALLLLAVVAVLNLAAIFLREKIRRKFRTGAFA